MSEAKKSRHRKEKDPDKDPNHKRGKRTGYSRVGDMIWPAPSYMEEFKTIREERWAALAVLRQVQDNATMTIRNCAKRQNDWWARLSEDLDLSPGKWVIDISAGCVILEEGSTDIAATADEKEVAK